MKLIILKPNFPNLFDQHVMSTATVGDCFHFQDFAQNLEKFISYLFVN